MSKLVRIRTFTDKMSAENAKNFLEANEVEAMLSSDDAGGLRPELTLARGVKLWVNEEDEKKAKELLEMAEKQNGQNRNGTSEEKSRGFLVRVRNWLSWK